MAISITSAERIELRSAELAALCGYCAFPSGDAWESDGNTAWVRWCGRVAQYNPERQWCHGCTAGQRIGTRLRSSCGSWQALASRLP